MLSPPSRGNDTGTLHRRGTPHVVPLEGKQHVVSPRHPPLHASSPLECGVSLEGWDNMWCPHVIPPHTHHPPLECGVSLEGGTICGVPASSPLTRIIPPWSVVSPWSVGQHVVSPCRPPSRASSPLECGVSLEGGTTCGVPASSPLIISRDMSSPHCFK